MNEHKVEWSDEATDDLARLWVSANDRQAATTAADAIDRQLAKNPKEAGTHLSEGLYQIAISPLVAYFRIDDAARMVCVEAVRRIG
jgi:hypothetical protein